MNMVSPRDPKKPEKTPEREEKLDLTVKEGE